MKLFIYTLVLAGLMGCTSTPVTLPASHSVVNHARSVAGDNPLGETGDLFGDCTLETLNKAMDWGSYPGSYAQIDFPGENGDAISFDVENESYKGPKGATKIQTVFVTRVAAEDGYVAGGKTLKKGEGGELQSIQFLLKDGTNKSDCNVVDSKTLTKAEALAAKPAKSHRYFKDPCALLAVNTAAKYLFEHNPHHDVIPGQKQGAWSTYNKVFFDQSYRIKDGQSKNEWLVLNTEVRSNTGDTVPVQARLLMEQTDKHSCKILQFDTKTGWEKAAQ